MLTSSVSTVPVEIDMSPAAVLEWFTGDIDKQLRSPHPPPCKIIVSLYLLRDREFILAVLDPSHGFRGHRSIVGISRDVHHPLYYKVRQAYEFAQDRRKRAGFKPDPWPLQFADYARPDLIDRRLMWEPVAEEIKEAWRLYHRFLREGYRPFSVDSEGEPLALTKSFNPRAGEMMFLVGG